MWMRSKPLNNELNKSHMEYITGLLDFGQIENNKPKCSITKRFWSYIKGRKRDNVGNPTLKVKDQGPVVRKLISAHPGLKVNQGFNTLV